jgi:hypothetical protein
MLLTKWFDDPLRPTQDLDLLGFGDDDPDEMVKTFREICAVSFDDGVVFDVEGVQIKTASTMPIANTTRIDGPGSAWRLLLASLQLRPCVYRKPLSELKPRWNRLSWPNDRAALFRSGRPGLAIQVEVAA